jgi:hypothetical protein
MIALEYKADTAPLLRLRIKDNTLQLLDFCPTKLIFKSRGFKYSGSSLSLSRIQGFPSISPYPLPGKVP